MLNVIKLYLEVIILYVHELNLPETEDIDSYNIRDQRVLLSCTSNSSSKEPQRTLDTDYMPFRVHWKHLKEKNWRTSWTPD